VSAVFLVNLYIVSFLLQSTLLPSVSVAGASPDLILLLAVLVGLVFGPRRGLMLGALAGALEDALAGGPFGLHTLGKALVGLSSGFIQSRFGVEHRLLQGLTAALLTLAEGLLSLALVALLEEKSLPYGPLAAQLASQAAMNGLVGLVYFALIGRLAPRALGPGGLADGASHSPGPL
jgi:rod shape-determining protein MreD